MGKTKPYRTPEVTPAPLPVGTRVRVHTQGLIPEADHRYGRVVDHDQGDVQVRLEPLQKRAARTPRPELDLVWLLPWDIREENNRNNR